MNTISTRIRVALLLAGLSATLTVLNLWESLHVAYSIVDIPLQEPHRELKVIDPKAFVTLANNTASRNHGSNSSLTTKMEGSASVEPTVSNSFLFEDIPPRPHPHAGARDSGGRWHYVADVSRVRRWIQSRYQNETGQASIGGAPPSSFIPLNHTELTGGICNTVLGQGLEGVGWKVLDKVKVYGHGHDAHRRGSMIVKPSKGKILCSVYTYAQNHERILGIEETWGWHCDGFLAASTETIEDAPPFTTHLPHQGTEHYGNMYQKTRSILAYLHDHYLDEFEYFFLSGDDTHLIVSNLRLYLGEIEVMQNSSISLFAGQQVPGFKGATFIVGGGGYVLNRAALEHFIRHKDDDGCHPRVENPAEDRFVSKCFLSSGVQSTDAADEAGAQRFHSVDPKYWINFKGLGIRYQYWLDAMQFWNATGHGYKLGLDIVSTRSISFHMIRNYVYMKRIHAILYQSCPMDTVLGRELYVNGLAIQSKDRRSHSS